jgi:transcriptional regulator with XRE-family HTH domain
VNQLFERLNKDFQDEEARYIYADSVTNAFVSAQIKALREDRELTQDELAELIGTQQSGVSRLERPDYAAWKIETLRKLARAFRVRLRIRFEEFGTLRDEVSGFDRKNLVPRKFEDDPAFKEPTVKEPAPEEVFAEAAKNPGIVPHTPLLGLGGDQEGLERVRAAAAAMVRSALASIVGAQAQGLNAFPPAFAPPFAEPFGNPIQPANMSLAQMLAISEEREQAPIAVGVMAAQTPSKRVVFIDTKTELAALQQKPPGQEQRVNLVPKGDAVA